MNRGGRGRTRGGRSRRLGNTGKQTEMGTVSEEAPWALCKKIFGDDDNMMQCEGCLTWTCIKCADVTVDQYNFMTGKDQVKWYCSECNDKSKNTDGNITNEMLMTFMKNRNQNLTDIMSQLALKADKTETDKINKQINELDKCLVNQITGIDGSLEVLENNTNETPPPAQPSISKEAERGMVARATNELKEHNDRKNNVIVSNMPESKSNLKVKCRKHDLHLAIKLSNHCDEFQDDEIIDVNAETARPIIVKYKDEQAKVKLTTNPVSLKNSEEPYKNEDTA